MLVIRLPNESMKTTSPTRSDSRPTAGSVASGRTARRSGDRVRRGRRRGAGGRRRVRGCRDRGRSTRPPSRRKPRVPDLPGPGRVRSPGGPRRSGHCREGRTIAPSTSTTIRRRSVPTPGSTTARWTVPSGKCVDDLGQHERPLGDVLGRDRVADVHDLRAGGHPEDESLDLRRHKGRRPRSRSSESGFRIARLDPSPDHGRLEASNRAVIFDEIPPEG